jgi:hypothetical protein
LTAAPARRAGSATSSTATSLTWGGLDRCSKIKLGRLAASRSRDQVAGEMSSDQIAEAQKLAREWKPK